MNRIFSLHFRNIFFFLILCCIISLVLTKRIQLFNILPLLVFSVIGFVLYLFYLNNKSSKSFLYKLMAVTFIIKVITVFISAEILTDIVGIPFLSYKDDYVYDITSSEILKMWKTQGIGFYEHLKFSTGFYSGYPNFSALSKYLFTDSFYVPRLMNCLFSTFTVGIFYKTLGFYTDNVKNRQFTILFAFSLVFIVYSSFQLKDTLLVFFLAVIIYCCVRFIALGMNFKVFVGLLLGSLFILFFRAATLLPIYSALLLSYVFSKSINSRRFKVYDLISLILITIGFLHMWDFLNQIDLLIMNSNDYFDSRFSIAGSESALSGSNSLEKLGPLSLFLGPLYILFSLFLPTPLAISLDDIASSTNYHFIPTIQYYGILPMAIIAILFILKFRKVNRIGFFIVIFVLTYKLGQASSKSIFDSRQSLPAMYGMYLVLGFFNLSNPILLKLWNKYKYIVYLILIITTFSYSFLRVQIRS